MYSNVIVGLTISRASFVFSQSRVKVSTSLTNMDALVNDKQTYEEFKRDLTPALQRKLNSKILTLTKTNTTLTLLNETFTALLKLTPLTGIQHLLLQ